MIALYRVWAMVRRHTILYVRGLDKINTFIYWPLINIAIFGLTAYSASNADTSVVANVMGCIVGWQIMLRISMEAATIVLQEIQAQNIVNILSTPLTFLEWALSGMIIGFFTMLIVWLNCCFWVYILFGVNLWSIGWAWIPFLLLLVLSGASFSYLISGLFMRMGYRAIDIMFSLVWMFVPFSGAYAPLASLPGWINRVALFMPFSYTFRALRIYQVEGILRWDLLGTSFVLNMLFLTLTLLFFKWSFDQSKQLGIARLS
ncbi:MAG: hypothetical protein ACD_64C00245G0002 [uncultured bacterium]|nr:MAG: hypothetical protein ACD_64C00245G0002 [uncultured bacterium]HLE76630.1 ABC transporter permease [Candidatus Babeliales bacterium]